jgi:hypothetical protein
MTVLILDDDYLIRQLLSEMKKSKLSDKCRCGVDGTRL